MLTPVAGGVRIRLEVSEADAAKVKRGCRWSATVTDIRTGRRWQLRDRACSNPRCRCDATARPVTRHKRFKLITEYSKMGHVVRYVESTDYRPLAGDLSFAELRQIARMARGEELPLGGGASTASIVRRVR